MGVYFPWISSLFNQLHLPRKAYLQHSFKCHILRIGGLTLVSRCARLRSRLQAMIHFMLIFCHDPQERYIASGWREVGTTPVGQHFYTRNYKSNLSQHICFSAYPVSVYCTWTSSEENKLQGSSTPTVCFMYVLCISGKNKIKIRQKCCGTFKTNCYLFMKAFMDTPPSSDMRVGLHGEYLDTFIYGPKTKYKCINIC